MRVLPQEVLAKEERAVLVRIGVGPVHASLGGIERGLTA